MERLRDYRTLSYPKQKERKKKCCGCNNFPTERLHLERNVGSSKTIEIKKFSPLGDCIMLCYLVKEEQLSAGKALAFVKHYASSRARGGLGLLKQVLLKAIRRLLPVRSFIPGRFSSAGSHVHYR